MTHWMDFYNCSESNNTSSQTQIPKGKDHMNMCGNFSNLELIKVVLYRELKGSENIVTQLLLPKQPIVTALTGLHNDMSTQARLEHFSLLIGSFSWTNMNLNIENWIKICGRCLRRKYSCRKALLVNIKYPYSLKFVCLDYLTKEESPPFYIWHIIIHYILRHYRQRIKLRK